MKPNIEAYFTNAKLTTNYMDDKDNSTIYDLLKIIGFYSTRHTKGLNSTRKEDALYNLQKAKSRIRNPPLPAIENVSDNSQEDGVKIIIPSSVIDIYTRLQILLGRKLSGRTDTITEASSLIDEIYKRGEIQNEKQYRNALNKFST